MGPARGERPLVLDWDTHLLVATSYRSFTAICVHPLDVALGDDAHGLLEEMGVACVRAEEPEEDPRLNWRALRRVALQRALSETGGNRTRTAELLGISTRTLRDWIRREAV